MRTIVAIDGPAGSGKGTLADIISKRCNLVNIDTGAMYRCIAVLVLRNNVNIEDEDKVVELTKNIDIKFDNGKVLLNGEDVTDLIRSKEVTKIVSPVSGIVKVREILVDLQRKMAYNCDVVMEGRDITTVVFPNANFKFYLDATLEERANRRLKQNQVKGIDMGYDEIYEVIKARDYNDMHKKVGSLIRTEDQVYIDSTNMTIDEVADRMEQIIKGE